ncbi:MAG: geranylgeranyl reductase family protein [Rhizobiaceae bacterium]
MCGLIAIADTDVLVVGLGPAGASAAMAAARAGCSVVALERNASPGLPVQCAEFVPLLVGADPSCVDFEPVQSIDRMDTYVEDNGADVTLNFRGQMIDRSAFDRQLVEEAKRRGTDCRYGLPLRGIHDDGIVEAGDGMFFRSKVVVGADGPRSLVARHIGSPNSELVETRQITVALNQPHDATDIFLSASIPGGYGWLFPKGKFANMGLGVAPASKTQLKPLLEKLHARLFNEGRVGSDVIAHTGGAIPVGGIRNAHATIPNALVLLAGDAAGLTNPVTGAGINSAVISGRMAGDSAVEWIKGNSMAGTDYQEEIEDLFSPSIERARARRRQVMAEFSSGGYPEPEELRSAWIAYPQYWAKEGLESQTFEPAEARKSA